MVSAALKLVSVICTFFVLVSFGLFAYDQASVNSKAQATSVTTGTYVNKGNALPHHPAQPRRLIDGAAHTLTAPFRALVKGDSLWAVWITSTLLGVLVYGVGLGFVARFVRLQY